jgi:hypothetical protein
LVIRDVIAKALVHYYPFAGCLKELRRHKLAVDCAGQGVLFVEGDTDASTSSSSVTPATAIPVRRGAHH